MNWLIAVSIFWVFASATVAMLPMRYQYVPGLALLLAAPVLIVLIGVQINWIAGAAALFAFLSMYRNPLIYLTRKALGLPTSRPPQ